MIRKPCRYKQTLELIFKAANIIPIREYKFHDKRKWRLDYAFPEIKLAVEYEGLNFLPGTKSRHTTISGFTNDAEKYNELSLMGWRLLRMNAVMINEGIAASQIMRAVK